MLLTLFSISCNTESKHQNEAISPEAEIRGTCPNTGIPIGCNAFNFGPLVFNIRGCDHKVWYRVIECASGITIDNFVWTRGTDAPCLALEATMVSPSGVIINTVYYDVIKELTLAVQDSVVKSYSLADKYPCTNAGSNPCTAATYAVGFSLAGCKALCANLVSGGEEGPYYTLSETACGDACCKRTTPFCIKDDGTYCYGTPVITSVGSCSPAIVNCQEGSGGTCRMPCVKL
jgi:hypothetical protein